MPNRTGNVLDSVLPPVTSFQNALTINTSSYECLGVDLACLISGFSSGVWTANLAIYVPFIVLRTMLVSQFFWFNGAAVDLNTDVGIYSEDGATKLGSTGSTGNSGTSQIQVVNVTDFILAANRRYWLALSSDSSTQTYWRNATATRVQDYIGTKQQAAAWSSGLPTSATFAAPSVAALPLFGLTGTTI
jgi:hypothetical protein